MLIVNVGMSGDGMELELLVVRRSEPHVMLLMCTGDSAQWQL